MKDVIPTEVAKTPHLVIPVEHAYIVPQKIVNGKLVSDYDSKVDLVAPFAASLPVDGDNAAFMDRVIEVTNLDFLNAAVEADTALLTTLTFDNNGPADRDIVLKSISVNDTSSVVDDEFADHTTVTAINKVLRFPVNVEGGQAVISKYDFVGEAPATSFTAYIEVNRALNTVAASLTNVSLATSTDDIRLAFEVAVSSAKGTQSNKIETEIRRKDFQIPTAQHWEVPMSMEEAEDMQALFGIDAVKTRVDKLTKVIAHNLDKQILRFLVSSYSRLGIDESTGQGAVQGGSLGNYEGIVKGFGYFDTFNVAPTGNFAMSPTAWRNEVFRTIDYLAIKMKEASYFEGGLFTIVGGLRSASLFVDAEWKFKGNAKVSGVDVDYRVGYYQGLNDYRLVATRNLSGDDVYVFFTPKEEDQLTYKYFPYTLNMTQNYRSAHDSNLPTIVMTKRDLLVEHTPMISKVKVINNNFASSANQWVASGTDRASDQSPFTA